MSLEMESTNAVLHFPGSLLRMELLQSLTFYIKRGQPSEHVVAAWDRFLSPHTTPGAPMPAWGLFLHVRSGEPWVAVISRALRCTAKGTVGKRSGRDLCITRSFGFR